MYKTISNKIIREFNPCYDPYEIIKDEEEELPVIEWVNKYREFIKSDVDIIWLLLRYEYLSDKDLRLFAVWCARESLKSVENPDKRSINAVNIAEKYANGEVTKEELDAAEVEAVEAACSAAISVSRQAWSAARSASRAANAAWAASMAWSASMAANAPWPVTQATQLDKLLTYFK